MDTPSEHSISQIGATDMDPPPISASAESCIEDDNISLTSTAASEFQDEYEVETIHAQEFIDGEKRYLVKWKGYSDLRCTWEPVDSFNSSETLDEWRRKKRAITRGIRAPFDIEKWEAECKAFEEASQERKRRRKGKRARLALLASAKKDERARPVTDSDRPTNAQDLPPSSDHIPQIAVRGKALAQPKNVNDTRSIHTTGNQPKTRGAESTTGQLQKDPARRSEIPRAAPPKPVAFTVQSGRAERKDLASVLHRARQQEKTPTDQIKTWKLFSTTHKFEKASRQDPEPNRDDLELQSPKTWSPFQMSASLRRRKSTEHKDNSLFVEQDEPAEIQESTLSRSRINASSPILHSKQPSIVDETPPSVSSTYNDQEARRATLTNDSYVLSEPVVPIGPRGWKPGRKGFIIRNRELTKKSDILCKLSHGSEAIEIGDALLCDLSSFARSSVYSLKHRSEIRIRFEELCTLEHYQSLSDEIHDEILFNGCITAYSDTQEGLSNLEKVLLDKDLVGIARVCPRPSQPDYGLTLLCYPTKSKNFQFLNKHAYDVPEGSLCVAGRSGILPRRSLNVTYPSRPAQNTQRYERPEREGRFGEPGKSENDGLIPWRHPSTNSISAPQPDDPPLEAPERPVEALTCHSDTSDQGTVAPQTAQLDVSKTTAADNQTEVSADLCDAMDISDSSSQSAQDKLDHSVIETPDLEEPNLSLPIGEASNEISHPQTAEDKQDISMIDVDAGQNIEGFIKDAFPRAFNIDFKDIAAITSRSSMKLTNCFYLWFPESADGDFQILEQFLESHCAIILSNRKKNDWGKFTKSSTGVALFHHTFIQYHELPGFHKLTMSPSFNFWSVSLSYGIPNLDTTTNFQRLFPQGSGYLMTEDFMLHERDAAILILAWFRDTANSKLPGTTKMMFRPDILKWLDVMSIEDPRFTVMAVLIGDTACQGDPLNWPTEARDLDCFTNPFLQSPVLSVAAMRNPDGPAAQDGTDADLLCELFSAWTILNAASLRRFHVLTHLTPKERWQKWQHIEIIQGANDFFQRWNINKDNYLKWLAQKNAASPPQPTASSSSQLSGPLPLSKEANQWNLGSHAINSSHTTQTAAASSRSRMSRP
ncbi:hypothetical protein UA08_00737 [Talaromyces atroroseus]|uniref:Chromo domain-containing protein n=1 Tax=Talaromyces atroroseus TaxID=1441469 RepID=A0A225AVV8_TALAT|nr:hypothetical protein UA08_00737 [Talaromyces atroroseus]OKL63753.1 hypothetical protein UA08_00737 [Talaromyces atroroseus]